VLVAAVLVAVVLIAEVLVAAMLLAPVLALSVLVLRFPPDPNVFIAAMYSSLGGTVSIFSCVMIQ
jgi:hypothetical protein